MTKDHEKILDNSKMQDLSLTTRIILVAVTVSELQKSQDDTTVLLGTWTSLGCAMF